jgi:hypothetical protein
MGIGDLGLLGWKVDFNGRQTTTITLTTTTMAEPPAITATQPHQLQQQRTWSKEASLSLAASATCRSIIAADNERTDT